MKLARFVVFTVSCAALVAVFVTMTPSWSRVACGMPTWLLMGAALADALTPLGLLNFLVLQWFGVRLEAVMRKTFVGTHLGDELYRCTREWRLDRWIIPLTGWWSDYRYIARRP